MEEFYTIQWWRLSYRNRAYFIRIGLRCRSTGDVKKVGMQQYTLHWVDLINANADMLKP
jgi:hypothetical protein